MDEIDRKLAGLDRRVQARRAELQRALEADPGLAGLLSDLRETFGPFAVVHARIGAYEHGDPARLYLLDDGTRGHAFSPAPYRRPQPKKAGRIAALRERERLGQ